MEIIKKFISDNDEAEFVEVEYYDEVGGGVGVLIKVTSGSKSTAVILSHENSKELAKEIIDIIT